MHLFQATVGLSARQYTELQPLGQKLLIRKRIPSFGDTVTPQD
jgi:hypothetical protein